MVPVATPVDVPIILDEKILKLQPPSFWMGGGEVLLKLEVEPGAFLRAYEGRIFVADVTY